MKESTIKVVRDERGRFAKKDVLGNFKVGDRIRLLEKHWAVTSRCPAGTIAKIERKDGEGSFWCSPIPGYPEGFAFSPCPEYADLVELISDAPAPTPRLFKLGDVVRRINIPNNCPNGTVPVGAIGSIISIKENNYHGVKWNNGVNDPASNAKNLELVPNAPKQRKTEKKAQAIEVPEEIPAALQTLAKAFGYRVEKA